MGPDNGILRFLACGSVDDGKSTLIGHLLHLTGSLYDDQVGSLEEESRLVGNPGAALDYSLLLDGLMAEREQGITIDVAYRYFATAGRKFIVADVPGHEQYTRNMATGASQCSAALILIDVRKGVMPQTRRHALICALMGIRRILFAVNKMDAAGWAEPPFRGVESECRRLVAELEHFGFPPEDHLVVPVSARCGDNLAAPSPHLGWYGGMTILEWLDALPPVTEARGLPFRFPVQYVIKAPCGGNGWQHGADAGACAGLSGTYRAYAGTVVSGGVKVGDGVVLPLSGRRTTVAGIWRGDRRVEGASAGMAVALELTGEHDIGRGECIALEGEPAEVASLFKVRLVWMAGAPLYPARQYRFRSVFGTATAEVVRIRDRIDLTSMQRLASDRLSANDVGECELKLSRPVPFDPYGTNRETGGFILVDNLTHATVACGVILHPLRRSANVQWQAEEVGRSERAGIKRQRPCVVWLTGLPASGKSTIANALERRLHLLGRHTMLLDGDNVRHGLNQDLGFTEADRIENIRRVGEVAKLMADAGLIVIAAFISPFRAEREMVRRLLPEEEFVEVYVSTPIEECERRDPKGLYRKARAGQIPNFTGIDSPYEEPESPQVRLNTSALEAEECAEAVIRYLEEHGML